jgi:two-component system sensor histidine kinase/response regulator
MSKPRILVVDDQLLNIRLLERKLEMNDMEVISCTNGPEALRMASEFLPDVILLDIMMAGMNGLEVCRQLKEGESTREIPVIFITALTSKEEKIEGLEVGAADYVTKPLELDETLARVRTQMRIVQEHRDNIRLTQQLEQSRRQSAIMHLTEGIAHNLNNLLGVMVGYTNLMQMNAEKPEKILSSCERLETAIKRMTRIVHQLTVIGHFKSLQKEPTVLSRVLRGAVGRFHRITNTDTPVTVENALPADFTFQTNRELLEVCLERILQNAYESYFQGDTDTDPTIGEIQLEISQIDNNGQPHVRLRVLDSGKGIDESIQDSIFDPFVSSSAIVGRGMGLTIARHAVNCLGGEIELLPREEKGAEAVILLPMDPPKPETNGK